jgi:hypothetical protein
LGDHLPLHSGRTRLVEREAVAARMVRDWGALTQREAAGVLGLGSGAAVSAQSRRLARALASDRQLRKHVDNITAILAARQSACA